MRPPPNLRTPRKKKQDIKIDMEAEKRKLKTQMMMELKERGGSNMAKSRIKRNANSDSSKEHKQLIGLVC